MLDQVARLSAAYGPRGPVAIIATQPAVFGMALFRQPAAGLVEVFYDLAEAEGWLDARQVPPT
jgi:hypothetical protein